LVVAVTTTTNSVEALELLREKRDMFDLVISDVSMPEMDGFKLLEQVGLEMDLPFISKLTHLCLKICIVYLIKIHFLYSDSI